MLENYIGSLFHLRGLVLLIAVLAQLTLHLSFPMFYQQEARFLTSSPDTCRGKVSLWGPVLDTREHCIQQDHYRVYQPAR
ncbi:uncharacterized protein EV420DRAFT_1545326 [Desarmillaria tabescens]|uniref:Uncharacterized protein n=1 Tax=Armillaria tabescens TaxID=1929756 RepID=A0AA39N4K5_ARMTA|nr:uncharacterized protein EV420DRAFT_1545326 [Desarmillaria tabescens]KAK0457921.1 hypothetical protein EV420DRAFT_1545326 [Desarmillaria tabescens]